MNIASIDIGSNTVLLLVGSITNGKFSPILNKYRIPRLGRGVIKGGKILNENISRLIEILKEYKEIIQENNCKKIIITATNAMRIASNSKSIINRVDDELGMKIEIIPGEVEAKLSFLGASSTLPEIDEKVVIDIGGGSTEVIYGSKNGIFFKNSFHIGVVSLTEKYLNIFPYQNKSLLTVKQYLEESFSVIRKEIPSNIPTIAVAGTPTTLSCIYQGLKTYNSNKVEGSVLTSDDLTHLHNILGNLSGAEIANNFGAIVKGREDVIFSGLLILKHIQDLLLSNIVYISDRGIRYGNIINYINISKVV